MPLAIRPPAVRGNVTDIGEDDLYEMLGNPRRRHTLRYLRERDGPVAIGELAEHIAAAENGIPVEEVTHAQRKSAYTALYQNHLKKLADSGFVQAERRWVDVELTPAAKRLDFGFDGHAGEAQHSSRYAVALSFLSIVTAAAFSFGLLSPLTAAASFGVLLVALFVVST
ncbi:winged helix-turn-helix domain-containing protein [Halogeometricum luteum]|uniref:Winged helix-turn-helix domain-containing protein n=1 Tax=Halogeometricum luteum TaxID=2950537 RepID=A0ABU2G476_9EURY|nr:winged helix-turn-helix domain-containing protein [Halogeometricum sp. S3BR5-2]MDS0295602.1 winged helix-turn-helix domain-containing protein [Halogeometricum sp. S3BR5-2]